MTNVKSKKSNIHCESHRCKVCSKSLYEYSTTSRIVFTSIMFSAFLAVIIFATYMENISSKDCYERHYISGRGTDIELIQNLDIECPN